MTITSCNRYVSMMLVAVLLGLGGITHATAQDDADDESAESRDASDSSGEDETTDDSEEDDEPEVDADKQIQRATDRAGRKATTRAIRHYEKGLRAAPEKFPTAYYNLAQVWEAKEEWGKALLHYQAYRAAARTKPSEKEANEAIDRLLSRLSDGLIGNLTLDVEPEDNAKLYVDGFLIARDGDLKKGKLFEGEYTVRADIKDYHPAEKTIAFEKGASKTVELRPNIKTFYGKADVQVNKEDATVKFKPKDLDSPKGPDEPITHTSPLEEPVELVTGKYLLEVTKDDFHRWVRYINIKRDKTTNVQVELSEQLPEEIR